MFDFSTLALQTPQLRLRPADAAAVFTLDADREAMRHWSRIGILSSNHGVVVCAGRLANA